MWVDPSFQEVPAAPGALIGLVRHDTTTTDLAESAAFAFAGLSAARARFQPAR
jgi:hypothetical protein